MELDKHLPVRYRQDMEVRAPTIELGYGRVPQRARIEPYLPGWALPDRFGARWSDFPGAVVTMTVMVAGRVPTCAALAIEAKPGRAVDGGTLRSLPVATMLEYAVAAAAQEETEPGYYRMSSFKSPEEFRQFRERHPLRKSRERWQLTPEHLRQVAEVYRSATHSPVKEVARHWNKPRATASRWIVKARDEGYFDQPAESNMKGIKR